MCHSRNEKKCVKLQLVLAWTLTIRLYVATINEKCLTFRRLSLRYVYMEAYKKSLMWWQWGNPQHWHDLHHSLNSIFFTKRISKSSHFFFYILLLFQAFQFTMKYQFDIYIIKAPKTFSKDLCRWIFEVSLTFTKMASPVWRWNTPPR